MNIKKKLLSLTMAMSIMSTMGANVFASSEISQHDLETATQAPYQQQSNIPMTRAVDSDCYTIPGGKGTLTSNAWRSTYAQNSGNTLKWDYQVSAEYSGNVEVERIRSTWQGSASLKNSASIDLGIGSSGVSAGTSSSWQNVKTVSKYWENSNGATTSSYR